MALPQTVPRNCLESISYHEAKLTRLLGSELACFPLCRYSRCPMVLVTSFKYLHCYQILKMVSSGALPSLGLSSGYVRLGSLNHSALWGCFPFNLIGFKASFSWKNWFDVLCLYFQIQIQNTTEQEILK